MPISSLISGYLDQEPPTLIISGYLDQEPNKMMLELDLDEPWQNRVREYIKAARYRRIPGELAKWNPNHFVCFHEEEDMIRYMKGPLMAQKGRWTVSSIQGYLSRYYKDRAPPGSDLYNELCLLIKNNTKTTVLFATTPDDIEKVYTSFSIDSNRLSLSCMRHPANHWKSGVHPCRVYGAGDLAIAYLVAVEDEDKTTHRTLCYPEKKIYSRMYGDDDKLHKALEKLGYKKSAYYDSNYFCDSNSFAGARLLKQKFRGHYIIPYLDDPIYVFPDDEYLRLTDDPLLNKIEANSPYGIDISEDNFCEEFLETDDDHV